MMGQYTGNVSEADLIKIIVSIEDKIFYHMTSLFSCHKNHMTTRVLTLLREYVTSLTTSVTTM